MIAPLAMDTGVHMVNVKPTYLLELEIDSMKKFIFKKEIFSKVPQISFTLDAAIRTRGAFGHHL